MTKKPLIKGIGKLNVDLVFDKLPRLPEPGEELYAASFEPLLGGGVPSMLYHAASFGAEIELLTYIGKGYFSKFVREKLAEKRIAYRNLMPDGATGSGINVTSVMLTPGERSFVTCSGEWVLALLIYGISFSISTSCISVVVFIRTLLKSIPIQRTSQIRQVK